MKDTIRFILVTVLVFMISCEKENSEMNEIQSNQMQEIKADPSTADKSLLIEELEGIWREPEYPFRKGEFKDSTVKFVEEGVVEEPHFETYEISHTCPFLSGPSHNRSVNKTYFVKPEDEVCEIISISNDTLTFSGIESDYTIVYKRIE